MARSVHIIPEAGIRRIEELESRLAMVLPSAEPRDEAHVRIGLDDVFSRRRGWWVGGHSDF